MTMHLLENAVLSIRVGTEDFETGEPERMLSAVRNIYAGLLLLYKEKLRRLSPPNSNECLVKERIVPSKDDAGKIQFTGIGKKTVSVPQIKERFQKLNISVDWKRLDTLTLVRNDIEHYFTHENDGAIRGAVSDSFLLIRDAIDQHLDEKPLELLGENCWSVLLSTHDVFEKEQKECLASLELLSIGTDFIKDALEELRCPGCNSTLIKISEESPSNDEIAEISCKSCGNISNITTVIESHLEDLYGYEIYEAAKESVTSPVETCPCCSNETYVHEAGECVFCGYSMEHVECSRCYTGLSLDEQDLGGLCGYCNHLMMKDD